MIKINNIYKHFNGKHVLDGVSLEVAKGETVAIIGPSGCGKSTLLRLIIGFNMPNGGQIYIDGHEITSPDEEKRVAIRRRIGMVFQSSALFSSLSVFENVAFGLREQALLTEREISEKVHEKLSWVGLSSSAKLMPEELSGGMQKRVSLARALANQPEILLYDEPTTGLDPIMSTSIENLIKELDHKLGITAIVVTHQMHTVYQVADRILMLHQGKIIEAGNPTETQESQNPIIREFVTGGGKEIKE